MKGYKGFDKDLKCRDFQYEVGKTYETDEAKLCEKGFHFCEAPFDVLDYYGFLDSNGAINRFCEVEADDVSEEKSDDSKRVSKKLKIGAEIGIPGLVKAQVEYVKAKCGKENKKKAANSANSSVGYMSANSSVGDRSANSSVGDRSANSSVGDRSANSSVGYRSANSSVGYMSANSSVGDRSANSSVGYRSANSSVGYGSANSSVGYRSANSSVGYGSANVSTGVNCRNESGTASINVGWGRNNMCRGKVGAYIVLGEFGEWDGEKYQLLGAKMGLIDGETLKPDTWYKLKNGEFVEVDE